MMTLMESKERGASWPIVLLVVIILAAIGFWLWSDNRDREEVANDAQNNAQEAQEAIDNDDLLSKIVDNPEQYYNKEVTVRGEIQDLQSRRVFKISDQTVGDELLVITRNPLSERQANEAEELFEDNADVRAKGTVRQLVIADIEREFGIDLSEQIEVEFRDKPVLIADSFTFSDKNAVLDFTQGP